MKCLAFSTDRPDHLILFRTFVSRKAAGNERPVLEGVGLDAGEITELINRHPHNQQEAVQEGLVKWRDGRGLQPPTWGVLLEAMVYAEIAQQHVKGLKEKLFGVLFCVSEVCVCVLCACVCKHVCMHSCLHTRMQVRIHVLTCPMIPLDQTVPSLVSSHDQLNGAVAKAANLPPGEYYLRP